MGKRGVAVQRGGGEQVQAAWWAAAYLCPPALLPAQPPDELGGAVQLLLAQVHLSLQRSLKCGERRATGARRHQLQATSVGRSEDATDNQCLRCGMPPCSTRCRECGTHAPCAPASPPAWR